jgi:ABC-type Fe3+/spermidine/putrescine transport system ATPase subunit
VSIRAELIAIQRQLEITTIYVTHDQDEALAMSDWVAVMNQGHVIQWGTPWDVYYRPRTTFMAEFLGSVNLVPATVIGVDGTNVGVLVEGHRFAVTDESPPPGDQVLLSIRPETLTIRSATQSSVDVGRGDGCVSLSGEVVHRTFLGHLMRYTVRIGQHDWLVDQPDPGRAELAEGAVIVEVNPRRVHVIAESKT